jgi:hypothetical protein
MKETNAKPQLALDLSVVLAVHGGDVDPVDMTVGLESCHQVKLKSIS